MIPTQNHQKHKTTTFRPINSANGLEKQILSAKICGTKSRGRQRTKYTNNLNNFVTRIESQNNELIRRTDDWCSCLERGVCDLSIMTTYDDMWFYLIGILQNPVHLGRMHLTLLLPLSECV